MSISSDFLWKSVNRLHDANDVGGGSKKHVGVCGVTGCSVTLPVLVSGVKERRTR